MKARHVLMVAGVGVAAWLALFGDKTPSGTVAEPVARGAPSKTKDVAAAPSPFIGNAGPSTRREAREHQPKPEPTILALRPRDTLIGGAASGNKSAGLFSTQSWVPPPPPPPKPAPPPPPTAPPLPFTYIGKKVEDATWEVYLTRGDQTFIVHEQSEIEGTYRVEAIKPPILTLTYLPLKQMQTLTVGGVE